MTAIKLRMIIKEDKQQNKRRLTVFVVKDDFLDEFEVGGKCWKNECSKGHSEG